MSGGVDSSVAALLLCRQGWEVIGATMVTGYGRAAEQAAAVCAQLGIEHRLIDMREAFERQVITAFVEAYASGLTPNPCVDCNAQLKFPAFCPLMEETGAEALATGHYTSIVETDGRYTLRCAADDSKDQTYFLYRLDQDTLARCRFPLGELSKAQVRALATEAGLSSAGQKDSYDVCFIEDGDYRALLQERVPERLIPGDIMDEDGRVLGRHQGLANYTLGQRRGLDIAMGDPAYVTSIDQEHNRLTLGPKQRLYHSRAVIDRINILPRERLEKPFSGQVKVRYKAPLAEARISPDGEERLILEFAQPVWGMTAGQSAVIYEGDILFGGGRIIEADR